MLRNGYNCIRKFEELEYIIKLSTFKGYSQNSVPKFHFSRLACTDYSSDAFIIYLLMTHSVGKGMGAGEPPILYEAHM